MSAQLAWRHGTPSTSPGLAACDDKFLPRSVLSRRIGHGFRRCNRHVRIGSRHLPASVSKHVLHAVADSAADASSSESSETLKFDVVIVGAGIIGLSIAHRLLFSTDFSVAVVDAARPCAGATGAGQGYIWLGHKRPKTPSWPLSKRSKELWDNLAEELQTAGVDPLITIGYKKTGSLLFGSTSEHAFALQERAEALRKEGIQSEYLDLKALVEAEPQLNAGSEGSAIFTHDDSQIDAHLTASYIGKENRKYCARYEELFYDPVMDFLWSGSLGHVVGIRTARRKIYSNLKVIVAAGAWSGDLLQTAFKTHSLPLVLPTKPRKGHLLVFEGLTQVSLKHALMEFAYDKLAHSSDMFGIAGTATIDAEGRLLLGSSRQFTGFDYNLQYDVMEAILKRAQKFLPVLESIHLAEALKEGSVRVGHRPYVPDGRPMIGEIPGLDGLLLATGHEGEGLSLALGTAEMVVNLLLDKNDHAVDPSPFSPAGRLAFPEASMEAVA